MSTSAPPTEQQLCACGCGAPVVQRDASGKLTYNRFVRGHQWRGRKHSPESVQRTIETKRSKAPSHKSCTRCRESKARSEFLIGGRYRGQCTRCYNVESSAAGRERWHEGDAAKRRAMKKYNLTSGQYDELVKSVACHLCGRQPELTRDMVVDHCHQTGVVRGRLCRTCNMGLGAFKDDPALLRAAADYIENQGVNR